MELSIQFELGSFYMVTYKDGTQLKFQVVGGPNADVNIIGNDSALHNLNSLLQNFERIEMVTD